MLRRLSQLGARVRIPERVIREVNLRGSRLAQWIERHPDAVVTYTLPEEDNLYLQLIKENPGLGDGEAQAIAVAYYRQWTMVTEDVYARRVADRAGVRCINIRDLFPPPPIQPRLL